MKYIGTILAAYIILFVLDIMQKRNHKTTKSLNNLSIRTVSDVIHFESRQWKYSKCKGAG